MPGKHEQYVFRLFSFMMVCMTTVTAKLFTPLPAHASPEHLDPADLVIVGNWLGNSVAAWPGESGLGDAGRLANTIANNLGATVLAYDRPGTGNNEPFARPLQPYQYRDAIAETGELLRTHIAMHQSQHGPGNIILAGNSAAGSHAVQLVRQQEIAPTHLMVIDPIGLEPKSKLWGSFHWALYTALVDRTSKHLPKAKDDLPEEAQGINITKHFDDIEAYIPVWAHALAADGLLEIARNQPTVAMRVDFPERSFTASNSKLQALCQSIVWGRRQSRTGAGIWATVTRDRLHSSGSNFNYFMQRLLEAATLKPAAPDDDRSPAATSQSRHGAQSAVRQGQ
jgi:pimeloyl-ACP methyl ester carboxylesterase